MMIRRIVMAACLAAPFANSLAAEQTTKPQTVGDDITPRVGEVYRASKTIGNRVVANNGYDLGKVRDLVIDPFHARTALIIVRRDKQGDRKSDLVIPIDATSSTKKDTIQLKVDQAIAESSVSSNGNKLDSFTRRIALTTFDHFDLKPYWLDKKNKNSSSELDDQFVTFSQLKKKSIGSAAGQSLGKIRDVVISSKTHKVAYTLFAQSDDDGKNAADVYPIPIACFVVGEKSTNWKLELPKDLLENTKSIGKELPKEISRAWVEYVHVRYGGGVLDGVQRE